MLIIKHNPKIKNRLSHIPRLESEHLILEELQLTDAPYVFKFAGSEEVAKTVVWDAHRNIDHSLEYIAQIKMKLSNKHGSIFLSWGVRSKIDGTIFGLVSLTQFEKNSMQVGYVFHYGRWDSTLPMEALRSVIDYAVHSFPDLDRIQARCFSSNLFSVRLMERLAMDTGELKVITIKVRGKDRELNSYSVTRAQWQKVRLKSFETEARTTRK